MEGRSCNKQAFHTLAEVQGRGPVDVVAGCVAADSYSCFRCQSRNNHLALHEARCCIVYYQNIVGMPLTEADFALSLMGLEVDFAGFGLQVERRLDLSELEAAASTVLLASLMSQLRKLGSQEILALRQLSCFFPEVP